MNVYKGSRDPWTGETKVEVNNKPLPPRLDLANHSPTGFEWGYGGSGPAQLALAILANEYGDAFALKGYQQFKWDVISNLKDSNFTITSNDIDSWYYDLQDKIIEAKKFKEEK